GIGNTFSLMIADWANGNLLIALLLVAIASLVLGMGLPVTASYIVLATLSAPAIAGMISDRVVIDALADGTLNEAAKAVLMLGAPEHMALLAGPVSEDQAREVIRMLPLEVAAPLRDLVVPQDAAIAAILSAHMIIFWLSQDSNVTPPVALAAFTAAAIAKSPAMATGVTSWKLAKGLYIVPIIMAYTPILSGDWNLALLVFAFSAVGIYGLAGALQGCLERPIGLVLRAIVGFAGVACLWPGILALNLAGLAVVLGILVLNIGSARNTADIVAE
ncbi:MAG: TRAP transporter large permease subunit, partial [Boseongicola sp.]